MKVSLSSLTSSLTIGRKEFMRITNRPCMHARLTNLRLTLAFKEQTTPKFTYKVQELNCTSSRD